MRGRSLQDKIGQAVMDKPGMNRKMLQIKRSLDELEKLLAKKEKGKKA